MSELMSKPLKRFIVCFIKRIDDDFKKHVIISMGINENSVIEETCKTYNIPVEKIGYLECNKEGYIYCNKVYNPTIDEDA